MMRNGIDDLLHGEARAPDVLVAGRVWKYPEQIISTFYGTLPLTRLKRPDSSRS
jgi:hypothetical protein